MKIEFSFDDGHKLDSQVALLLEKYGFRGMFYVPLRRGEEGITEKDLKDLSTKHDIGWHTETHPSDMKRLDADGLDRELNGKGRKRIERIIGRKMTSFCYPKGKYNRQTMRAVEKHGFTEARTVDRGSTTTGWDPYRKPTTIHVYPGRTEEYKDLFKRAKELGEDGYFHVWGHSWEIHKYKLWEEFENIIKYAAKNL